MDIIIADAQTTPLVLRSSDGTEFIPYECVYALGEVKTTYDKSKAPIASFVQACKEITDHLKRENTDTMYLGHGIHLGEGFHVDEKRPYRNPLYRFMIIVKGESFKTNDVEHLYSITDTLYLPNAVCILDSGVLYHTELIREDNGNIRFGGAVLWPEIEHHSTTTWAYVNFGHAGDRGGNSLGALCFFLQQHLNTCILSPVNVQHYLGNYLHFDGGSIISERTLDEILQGSR